MIGIEEGRHFSVAYFEWAFTNKRPGLPNGGLHLLYLADGLFRCEPPHTFSDSKAVTLGGAVYGRLPDPNKILMKLRVNWGHASAQ